MMVIIGEPILNEMKMKPKSLITEKEGNVNYVKNHIQIWSSVKNYRYISLWGEMLSLFPLRYANYVCIPGLRKEKTADMDLTICGNGHIVQLTKHITCSVTCVPSTSRAMPGGKNITIPS